MAGSRKSPHWTEMKKAVRHVWHEPDMLRVSWNNRMNAHAWVGWYLHGPPPLRPFD